jgi:pimeloyl-ACP methyl ester carboxylesterase
MSSVNTQLPEKQFIVVDQEVVCYYEQGRGDVVLLLHGWPQTSYVWRAILPELSKKYRVIAIDLPGLGDSQATTKHDTRHIAAVINKCLTNLKISQLHLVGHDVGAWVATAYAFQYEHTLQSLTVIDAGIPGLISPAVFQPDNAGKVWQFYFHAIDDIPEWLLEGKERAYLSWYFTNKSFVKGAITTEDLDVYYQYYKGKEKLKSGFGYYRAFPESAKQNQSVASRLNIPILAVGGEHALGTQVGKAFEKLSSTVRTVSIKDCGHYVPEEQPDELTRLLYEFFAETNVPS